MAWFLGGLGAAAVAAPVLWSMLDNYQRYRIQVLFDPTLDPDGINERYHYKINLLSLTGGGLTGQGLFNGTRTQTPEALYAQHTDYIFSAIGEELGFLGCLFVVVLLLAQVIIRFIAKMAGGINRVPVFGFA